jgi:hypothetical protein
MAARLADPRRQAGVGADLVGRAELLDLARLGHDHQGRPEADASQVEPGLDLGEVHPQALEFGIDPRTCFR